MGKADIRLTMINGRCAQVPGIRRRLGKRVILTPKRATVVAAASSPDTGRWRKPAPTGCMWPRGKFRFRPTRILASKDLGIGSRKTGSKPGLGEAVVARKPKSVSDATPAGWMKSSLRRDKWRSEFVIQNFSNHKLFNA